MVGKAITIALRKRDITLKKWFKLASQNDVNVSRLVQCAIEYYAITGEYMKLGSVTGEDMQMEDVRKSLYIPQNGIVNEFISKRNAEGVASGKVITRILEKAVEIGSENNIITNAEAEDIIEDLNKRSRNDYMTIAQAPMPIVVNENTEKPEKASDEKVQFDKIDNQPTNAQEEPMELTEEEEMQKDFFARMISPGAGLGNKL